MERIPLEAYYTKDSLNDVFRAMADPGLDFVRDRDLMNRLILNFSIKYIAKYLEIAETEVRSIRDRVWGMMSERRAALRFEEESGREPLGNEMGADYYSLKMAADIRQTSAIVKEILSDNRFGDRGDFVGLDLGSGIGVLTAAMAGAAERARVSRMKCIGIEIRARAANRSRQVLEGLLSPQEILILNRDCLEPGLLRGLFPDCSPDYWVSETISSSTPPLDPEKPNFGLAETEMREQRIREKDSDPFIDILARSDAEIPGFHKSVKEGKTAMFPDLVNGRYVPNRERSTLRLRTGMGNPQRLEQVGTEFEMYEDLGYSSKRWESVGHGQLSLDL